MKIVRRKSKSIKIGKVHIGGGHPVAIQSMAKTKTADVKNTVAQIKRLEDAGCEIVRVAVRGSQDARAIKQIKRGIKIPLVADIHFDWRLAIEAIENGADKIRLNPGNIYKKEEIKNIVSALKSARLPLRIGVNSGSVRNSTSEDALVKSALDYLKIIEGMKFYNIVISLKGSGVLDTISSYRKMAKLCDYPLHLGVTATGSPYSGAIKSAVALGALLLEGIGDTIRISLTEEPVQEVYAAKTVLESLGLRKFGPSIISCPTCGRCEVNLVKLVGELENILSTKNFKPIEIAVMGCVVNGPGEAKGADIGVAFGKKEGLLFKKGKPIKKVAFNDCLKTLVSQIEKF